MKRKKKQQIFTKYASTKFLYSITLVKLDSQAQIDEQFWCMI